MTVSRRGFLRGAAAAAAALAAPAVVFGQGQKQLRWGVIGTGHRGLIHISAIKSFTDECEILGVCDVMDNHLAAGAKRAGGAAQLYSDYQKILACSVIYALLLATPNLLHREMVL